MVATACKQAGLFDEELLSLTKIEFHQANIDYMLGVDATLLHYQKEAIRPDYDKIGSAWFQTPLGVHQVNLEAWLGDLGRPVLEHRGATASKTGYRSDMIGSYGWDRGVVATKETATALMTERALVFVQMAMGISVEPEVISGLLARNHIDEDEEQEDFEEEGEEE